MLKAIELSKNYNGHPALDALNLNIEAGDVYCLLGANGAGKTTTINLFLNFIKPDGGKALVNGLDVAEKPLETKKYLAYIPEQVNLYKNLSGLENLDYFSALAGQENYSKEKLRRFLLEAGLQEAAAGQRVSGYSKGMRQKRNKPEPKLIPARPGKIRASAIRISPSIIAQEASNDIAGTGLERFQHFRSQVKEFDQTWADYFVPRIFRQEFLTAADFDRIPRFSYREEPLGSVVRRIGFGVLFLAAMTFVLLFMSFGKLKNYRLEG